VGQLFGSQPSPRRSGPQQPVDSDQKLLATDLVSQKIVHSRIEG